MFYLALSLLFLLMFFLGVSFGITIYQRKDCKYRIGFKSIEKEDDDMTKDDFINEYGKRLSKEAASLAEYQDYSSHVRDGISAFSVCDMMEAYESGWDAAVDETLAKVISECEKRMFDDYSQGTENDEIAQGCMASLIYYFKSLLDKR